VSIKVGKNKEENKVKKSMDNLNNIVELMAKENRQNQYAPMSPSSLRVKHAILTSPPPLEAFYFQ
jgi:hypothetical protein